MHFGVSSNQSQVRFQMQPSMNIKSAVSRSGGFAQRLGASAAGKAGSAAPAGGEAAKTGAARQRGMRQQFRTADLDGNGRLDAREKTQLRESLQKMDGNGDGKVQHYEKRFYDARTQADVNRDGILGFDEIKTHSRVLFDSNKDGVVSQTEGDRGRMQLMDRNRDGVIDVKDEKLMMGEQNFAAMDGNGDGQISPQEGADVARKMMQAAAPPPSGPAVSPVQAAAAPLQGFAPPAGIPRPVPSQVSAVLGGSMQALPGSVSAADMIKKMNAMNAEAALRLGIAAPPQIPQPRPAAGS